MSAGQVVEAREAVAEVELMQGEEIRYCLQADGLAFGARLWARLRSGAQTLLARVTGGHVRVFLVLTSMRLLIVETRAQWCRCSRVKAVHVVAHDAVVSAGSSKRSHLCFLHTRWVYVGTTAGEFGLPIKKLPDEHLRAFVTHLGQLVAHRSR